jgi:hypothetical protein
LRVRKRTIGLVSAGLVVTTMAVLLAPFGGSTRTNVYAAMQTGGCSASGGRWGDASGDGGVNIADAQQIARFSVSLSVTNPAALAARGDVNADG